MNHLHFTTSVESYVIANSDVWICYFRM